MVKSDDGVGAKSRKTKADIEEGKSSLEVKVNSGGVSIVSESFECIICCVFLCNLVIICTIYCCVNNQLLT